MFNVIASFTSSTYCHKWILFNYRDGQKWYSSILFLYWNYLLSSVGTSYCSFGIFTIITKQEQPDITERNKDTG